MDNEKDWASQIVDDMMNELHKSGTLLPFATLYNNKLSIQKSENLDKEEPIVFYFTEGTENVETFFFDLVRSFMKDLTIPYSEREIARHYYSMLGLACQGRIGEIEYHYNTLVENKKEIISHLEKIKPLLYNLAQIAKDIQAVKTSRLSIEEKALEYEDKKFRTNKLFMDNYKILKKLYIKDFHFSIYD